MAQAGRDRGPAGARRAIGPIFVVGTASVRNRRLVTPYEAMAQRVSHQVRLKSRPSGIPEAERFEIVEAPVPDPSNGQVLVRNIYLSVDPAMRG